MPKAPPLSSQPPPTDGAGRRLGALDPFRGLLALGVATYHLSVWFGIFPSGSFGNMAFAKLGNFGVSAFFILSGFLAFRLQGWEDLRREGLGRYYLRRWLRLAPLFYLAVALNLVLALGMGPEPSLRMVAENLSFTFGAIHPNHALVVGGWYVGLVALLYAAFPLLAWLRERGGAAFLALAALGLTAWSLDWTLHRVPEAAQGERFHAYVQPANQVFLFLWGALGAWLHARWTFRLRTPAFLTVLALFLTLFLWVEPRFYDHLAVLTGPLRYRYLLLVLALVLVFAFKAEGLPAWTRPLERVGDWSYGAYLFHPFLYRLVAPRLGGWPGLLLALGLSFLAAALAARWIERPAARWGKARPA